VREIPSRWTQGDRSWISPRDYSLDIQRDGKGEFFELRVPTHLSETLDVTVTQSEPKRRHLLLFVRKPGDKPQLDRFLCGHDEREWFVAAVPGGASSVRQAMDALQPAPVRQALTSHKVSTNKRYSRKNRAFRRQGEWFFVPEPTMVVDPKLVLRDEPLRVRNPKAVRPWQHVLEPLSGYVTLAERLWDGGQAFWGAWNFGPDDGGARPVEMLADKLVSLWGKPARWVAHPGPHPQEAHFLKLDSSKARERLGWKPRLGLDKALAWTVEWYKACALGGGARALCLDQIDRFDKLTIL